jgi:hypothetical protein
VLTAQRYTIPLVKQATAHIGRMAHVLVPRGDHMSGSGKRRSGKTLAAALYSKLSFTQVTVLGRVGADKRYAETAHQGSKPHIIRGRGKMLKFRWERANLLIARRGGRRREFVFLPSVRHPGNKRPVRYLTTPLSLVASRMGFLVFGVGRGRSRLP